MATDAASFITVNWKVQAMKLVLAKLFLLQIHSKLEGATCKACACKVDDLRLRRWWCYAFLEIFQLSMKELMSSNSSMPMLKLATGTKSKGGSLRRAAVAAFVFSVGRF